MKANATNQMRITTSTKHNKLGQKKKSNTWWKYHRILKTQAALIVLKTTPENKHYRLDKRRT